MSTRTKLFVAATALAVLAFALARGDDPSALRQALEADPMATYAPPGGRLVDTGAQNEGSALGKPVFARYRRLFELAPATSEQALGHARAAAVAAGWAPLEGAPSTAFPDVFVAEKQVSAGRLQLGITVFRDNRMLRGGVKPPALLVSLRHKGS